MIRKAPRAPNRCFELSDSPGNDVFSSPCDGLGSVELSGLKELLGFGNGLQVHILTSCRPANVGFVDRLGGLGASGLGCQMRITGPDRLRRCIAARKLPLYFRFIGWVYSHVISSKYYDLSHSFSMSTLVTLDKFEIFTKFFRFFPGG